jgi:hypothetical protein
MALEAVVCANQLKLDHMKASFKWSSQPGQHMQHISNVESDSLRLLLIAELLAKCFRIMKYGLFTL